MPAGNGGPSSPIASPEIAKRPKPRLTPVRFAAIQTRVAANNRGVSRDDGTMPMSGFEFLAPQALPDLLTTAGVLKRLSSAALDVSATPEALRLWCHYHGRYGLPTTELVAWLRAYIAGRSAIEIGSGAGDLAWHLMLPATDNRCQEQPDVAAFYRALGDPVIEYPAWVERLDALDAIAKYTPDIVVASWVAQWADPDMPPASTGAVYGVKEDILLDTGVIYVLIGNLAVHGKKTIMARPHRELDLPFLRSRSQHDTQNRLFIWNE